jgi:hypothetical protein
MKKIDEEKILKEIEKVEAYIAKDNYHLTTKGIVSLVINLIEEKLK